MLGIWVVIFVCWLRDVCALLGPTTQQTKSQPPMFRLQAETSRVATREMMTFGKRVDIQITLPSRDHSTVAEFLQDEALLLDSTWEPSKYRRLSKSPASKDRKYLLLFPDLVLPGVDTISTEVEVEFLHNKNGLIEMKSGNWTLRGMAGNVVKDSRFMQSFNIIVQGELGISSMPISIEEREVLANSPIIASGWVEYRVQGEKPNVFKNAPPFVLDVTIKLIQDTVSEYATNQFSTRLLRGFRNFVMTKTRL